MQVIYICVFVVICMTVFIISFVFAQYFSSVVFLLRLLLTIPVSDFWRIKHSHHSWREKFFLRTASSSFMYLKECKYCIYYYCTLHFILEHTDLYFHWIKNIKDRNARSCWIIWKVFANLERRFFPFQTCPIHLL